MKVQYIKPQTEILLAEPQEIMDCTYGHDVDTPEAKEQSVVEDDFFSEKDEAPFGEVSSPSFWDDEKE